MGRDIMTPHYSNQAIALATVLSVTPSLLPIAELLIPSCFS